jgi:hypothetical protein
MSEIAKRFQNLCVEGKEVCLCLPDDTKPETPWSLISYFATLAGRTTHVPFFLVNRSSEKNMLARNIEYRI